ncbi:hypothetical protein BMS3Abin05_00181 [bacterium BMS3Abin05]|nr:hypothetical protein BMS3Abin05_00181 [bacterium BMS3Abin05]
MISFRLKFLHQTYPADFFKIGGKPHIQRFNQKLAVQMIKFFLGIKISPDACAVIEGGIGMFPADNNIRESIILAVNRVHNGFFRAAVKHFHIEANQKQLVIKCIPRALPQFQISIAAAD